MLLIENRVYRNFRINEGRYAFKEIKSVQDACVNDATDTLEKLPDNARRTLAFNVLPSPNETCLSL